MSYCDLVVWTNNDVHVERMYPDEELWFKNVNKTKQFFQTAVLPELIGKFFREQMMSFSTLHWLINVH